VALQVFREGIATTAVARSPTLAATGSGGVRQSSVQQAPGPAAWVTTTAMQAGATTVRRPVTRCAASGINTPCLPAGRFYPLKKQYRAAVDFFFLRQPPIRFKTGRGLFF
jgi:hypothetical protein